MHDVVDKVTEAQPVEYDRHYAAKNGFILLARMYELRLKDDAELVYLPNQLLKFIHFNIE